MPSYSYLFFLGRDFGEQLSLRWGLFSVSGEDQRYYLSSNLRFYLTSRLPNPYHHGLSSDRRRAEFSRRNGRNQPYRHGLETSRVRLPLSFFNAHFTVVLSCQDATMIVGKSIQPTRARFHNGSGSNTPGRVSDFLRIAFLGVLSAP